MAFVTASYSRDGNLWSVDVNVDGNRHPLVADTLLQARAEVDILLAGLSANGVLPRAVHLVADSAAAFTEAYLHARFGPKAETEFLSKVEGRL